MIFFEELNSFREAALEVSKQKFYFCHQVISTDGTLIFWSCSHIDLLGKLLYWFFKIFPYLLILLWLIWQEFVFRKICGGGPTIMLLV